MKKYFITFLALFFLLTTQSFSEERKKGVLENHVLKEQNPLIFETNV